MGTAELVANAILHGVAPISVRVRGTSHAPAGRGPRRLAHRPPSRRRQAADPEDFLATFGRGLSMVAMSAVVWGASIENRGKVVWFEPAAGLGDHDTAEPVFDSTVDTDVQPRSDQAVAVTLLGLDVGAGHRARPPVRRPAPRAAPAGRRPPGRLPARRQPVGRCSPATSASCRARRSFAVKRARRAGLATIDLDVKVEPEAAPILTTMLEMFDLADAFCKAERLLSLQRTPEQRAFHVWYLTEFIRQIDGEPPIGVPRQSDTGPSRPRPAGLVTRPAGPPRRVRVRGRAPAARGRGRRRRSGRPAALVASEHGSRGRRTFPGRRSRSTSCGCFVLAALPAVGAVRRSPRWTAAARTGAARRLHHGVDVGRWSHGRWRPPGTSGWPGPTSPARWLACVAAAAAGRLLGAAWSRP